MQLSIDSRLQVLTRITIQLKYVNEYRKCIFFKRNQLILFIISDIS